MRKSAKKKNSRLYLMGGLILVWAMVLINEFGGGSGETAAATTEVVTPSGVAVSLEVVPIEEQKKSKYLASKEILALQRAESGRTLGRNIFSSTRTRSTNNTRTNFSTERPILQFIGRSWVKFGTTKVRVGQDIPGTDWVLKAIEQKKGRVIVERKGTGETKFLYLRDPV